MIAIVNMGPHDDPDPLGERTYEVRINSEVIATFKHKRGDGLAKCLHRAGEAVDLAKSKEINRLFEMATPLTKPPSQTAKE